MDGVTSAFEHHRLTVHRPGSSEPDDPRKPVFQRMDPATRPPQTKTYEGLERTELPDDIDSHRLSRVLFGSAGVVRVAEVGGQRMLFRAAGSAGNLQPLEVYVLADGRLSHYDAPGHALVALRDIPDDTPPTLVITGVPWRTGWKYAERGWRHLYWDAGSMLAQTLELAPAARLELGFVDEEVATLVGADGVHELPLAVVALDGETRLPVPRPVPAGSLGETPIDFPLTTEAQHAGDLANADVVDAWRATGPAPDDVDWTPPGDLMDVIRRRGSTRSYDPTRTGGGELLFDAMTWATRPVPGDFTATTLLEHVLLVHGIEGAEPGVYRWPVEQPSLAGDVRADAKLLCLGQDLGGDSAYTVFHLADVEELDDRPYRAAMLEAGVVSGRLHLAAFSLGYGASGLTFFDELVRDVFETERWPVLVTTVGVPAYRNRRGGTPRAPSTLNLR